MNETAKHKEPTPVAAAYGSLSGPALTAVPGAGQGHGEGRCPSCHCFCPCACMCRSCCMFQRPIPATAQRPMSPDDEVCVAALMTQIFPDWLVTWKDSSAEFWAYPYFAEPAGTVLHDADPNVLADKMRQLKAMVVNEMRTWLDIRPAKR